MEIASLYKIYQETPFVTTDTRSISHGSIYFALKGERFDGNTFASQALEKGARIAIIDNKDYYRDHRTILVENALETLQKLANFHRKALGLPIIGITGTNGKTTTKELIREVLASKYNIRATQGNLNNHIGVPLTLLSMNKNTQIGIVEMGANHPFEINELSKIAEPNLGLITNIGKAHLEGFGGFQGVIKTKRELYDFLEQTHGTIFYNSDNQLLREIVDTLGTKKISYGAQTGEYCRGNIVGSGPFLSAQIECTTNEGMEQLDIQTHLVGGYNFENLLAAVSIGKYFNVPADKIKEAIFNYQPSNNRSQMTKTSKNKLLLDCYNANPSSTEAAIINFAQFEDNNKLTILGDMLELGDEAEAEHKKMLTRLSSMHNIKVLLVGEQYKKAAESFGYNAFSSAEELKNWLSINPITDHLILIKGSRGIKLEQVIEAL